MTARGQLERREMVLLRLRAEDGLDGLGEAVPLSLRGGASWRRSSRELESCWPSCDGARRGRRSSAASPASRPGPLRARSTALLDLRGRQRAPAARRGGDAEPAVRCNATLVAGEPAAVAADAAALGRPRASRPSS